jgi:hypothetical protein
MLTLLALLTSLLAVSAGSCATSHPPERWAEFPKPADAPELEAQPSDSATTTVTIGSLRRALYVTETQEAKIENYEAMRGIANDLVDTHNRLIAENYELGQKLWFWRVLAACGVTSAVSMVFVVLVP